jgi:hypothetical protein
VFFQRTLRNEPYISEEPLGIPDGSGSIHCLASSCQNMSTKERKNNFIGYYLGAVVVLLLLLEARGTLLYLALIK